MKIIIAVYCFISLCSFYIVAQPNSWEMILPTNYYSLKNDSQGNIYASLRDYPGYNTHIIRSSDNGKSWDTILTVNNSFPSSTTIDIDKNYLPYDRIIFDHTSNGYPVQDYISTDYGESWQILNSPDHLTNYRFTTAGEILGIVDYKLYRSTDDGLTWDSLTTLPTPSYSNYSLGDLEIDIFDNIYINVNYVSYILPAYYYLTEVYKSTDNGDTWSLLYLSSYSYGGPATTWTTSAGDLFIADWNASLSKHYLLNGNVHTYNYIVGSPWQKKSEEIYSFKLYSWPRKILFSPNSGNNWQDISSGPPLDAFQNSDICNDKLGYLYINMHNGIYKTTFTTERVFTGSTIDLGDAKLYDTTNIQVTINNPFDSEIEIDSIVSYDDHFFITNMQSNVIPAGDSIYITLAFSPTEYDSIETYIYLYSELINARTRVIGNSPYPVIRAIPGYILPFYQVPINSIVNKSLKILNNSLVNNLMVDTVFLNKNIAFNLGGDITFPIVVQPNDTTELSISFHPTEAILYTDTLLIQSNTETGLKIIELRGEGINPSSINEEDQGILEFNLNQNYPNPFNPTTDIKFQIAEGGFVTLTIYDVLGNEIATLVNEEKPAGSYEVDFNASSLPSGVYFYQLKAGSYTKTNKMILLK